jgi:hypothetical protein
MLHMHVHPLPQELAVAQSGQTLLPSASRMLICPAASLFPHRPPSRHPHLAMPPPPPKPPGACGRALGPDVGPLSWAHGVGSKV